VTRWFLLLQEFNIIVLDRPGKDNVVADFISQIKNEDDDILVNDSFPDEKTFFPLCKYLVVCGYGKLSGY
jgi:hypothetical protein